MNISSLNSCKIWLVLLNCVLTVNPASFREEFLECVQQVMSTYFEAKSLLIFDGRGKRHRNRHTLLPTMDDLHFNEFVKIIQEQTNRSLTISDKDSRQNLTDRYKRVKSQTSLFVFNDDQAQDFDILSPIFEAIKSTEYWNRQGRTLIIVHKLNNTYKNEKLAQNAQASLWKWNKAVHSTVMIAEVELFTFHIWFPYRSPDCSWVTERPVHDIWKDGRFLENRNLFPNTMRSNLEKCRLKVVSSECVPYNQDNNTIGFEARLVHTLRDYYNFTIEYQEVPKFFMTLDKNKVPAGAFKLLDNQKVDFGYGCLMLNLDRYKLAESLPIYFYDSLTWFVPTPVKNSHASNIFEAFSDNFWIAVLITTLSSLLVFLLIIKIEEYVLMSGPPQSLINAGLRVFAMTISTPFTQSSKKTLIRIFTFAFAIYSLHITTAYQASLYKLYKSNSYSNVYKTVEDAVNNNLFVWLRESTKELYDPSDGIWRTIMQEGRHEYISEYDQPFEDVAYKKSAILLFIKSTMLYYLKMDYFMDHGERRVMYLQQQFAPYPVTLFLSPGHPLLPRMNEFIDHLMSSGLVSHWMMMDVREQVMKRSSYESDVSLQLEHIGGAFLFYACLVTIASILFLLEVVYWYLYGKNHNKPGPKREELNLRRKLLFQTVVEMSRDRAGTKIKRFRRTNF